MLLPTIGVRDNIELEPNEYRFLLRGKEIVRSTIIPDRMLAMSMGGGDASRLNGIPTVEPVFGIQAMWVPEEEKRNAEVEGCTVVDPSSVLVTHLSDVLKRMAYLILEREGTQKLLDLIKDKNPTLVSELLPDLVNAGIIQRTLQNLLRERIPIKNLTLIPRQLPTWHRLRKPRTIFPSNPESVWGCISSRSMKSNRTSSWQ